MKKSSLILFVFSLLLLALAGITPAQEAEVLPLHIDTLIEEAVANNPSLEAARHEQKAASLRIKPTGTLPDPTVMLGFMSVPVDTFSFDEMDMTQKIISVSQAFPFPGKLKLAKEIAKSDAEVARWQIKIFEDRLVYELRRSFFNWVFSEEALRITEHNRKVIASFTKIATERYSVGKGNQWDILRAQVEHTKLREMQATIAQNIESLKAACLGGEKILLERRHAGEAGHHEGAHRAVRPPRLDEISAVAAEKACGDALVPEHRVVEIAQHRRPTGLRPGPGVMRTGPCPRLARVAGGAGP